MGGGLKYNIDASVRWIRACVCSVQYVLSVMALTDRVDANQEGSNSATHESNVVAHLQTATEQR